MYGYNIQSPFFEDTAGRIWFTTYEALNYYDPAVDNLGFYFMVSSGGDTLKSNYRAFHLNGNNLYLKAGTEVFVYDIQRHQIQSVYPIDLQDFYRMAVIQSEGQTILFAGQTSGYQVYRLEANNKRALLHEGHEPVFSVHPASKEHLWIGQDQGRLSLFDPVSGRVLSSYTISQTPINSIESLSDNRLLLTVSTNTLFEFDLTSRQVVDQINPIITLTKAPVGTLLAAYVDRDSTLWVGGDNQGLFYYNLKKQKFKHFFRSGPQQMPVSVSRIIPVDNETFVILTRRGGILLINLSGDILHHWRELPDGRKDFISLSGVVMEDNRLLFTSYNQMYMINLEQRFIKRLQAHHLFPHLDLAQFEKLSNGKLVASYYHDQLMEILVSEEGYTLKPYSSLKAHTSLTTYFKEDAKRNIYVSNDEVSLIVLEPSPDSLGHSFAYGLDIQGGIRGIADDPGHDAVYISNSRGLFRVDRKTRTFNQIVDKNNLLLQNIYSVLADERGDLWMGTNNGLMRYTPSTGQVKVFSALDGIQASEFNTHASLKLPDGSMFFGGVNGVNYFHPGEVKFSAQPAPIYISEVLINDEMDSLFQVPQVLESMVLPYARNTVSFEFHAIDYGDPEATRVKYKLSGVDDDYVESKESKGFARYANLPPGHYVMTILGANSDGIWNTSPKEISITIRPPFWMTWWFIALSVLAAAGMLYVLIRSYYQRRLAKQNQLLREQQLIIEKQQAIEHERTRIASEMHDDLGSGLTTIRYLSDKALHRVKDPAEADQIQRIADHSNQLVRNMSEIIWAMNSRYDNAENLVGYLRRYASEYLDEHNIPMAFIAKEDSLIRITISGEKRRNVFLVFKELLHNAVKYSGAEKIEILVTADKELAVQISEIGGQGFDAELSLEKGNGIFNCRKRMDMVGGSITFRKTDLAMTTLITLPIELQPHE